MTEYDSGDYNEKDYVINVANWARDFDFINNSFINWLGNSERDGGEELLCNI